MARAQDYKREQMMKKIEEDNLRSEKIKEERAELNRNRELLRQQIEIDKQKMLEDFEKMKQGKVNPDDVAEKYGYTRKEGGSMNQSGISHASKKSKKKNMKKKKKGYQSNSRLSKSPKI